MAFETTFIRPDDLNTANYFGSPWNTQQVLECSLVVRTHEFEATTSVKRGALLICELLRIFRSPV